jgi:hypothetical protein
MNSTIVEVARITITKIILLILVEKSLQVFANTVITIRVGFDAPDAERVLVQTITATLTSTVSVGVQMRERMAADAEAVPYETHLLRQTVIQQRGGGRMSYTISIETSMQAMRFTIQPQLRVQCPTRGRRDEESRQVQLMISRRLTTQPET